MSDIVTGENLNKLWQRQVERFGDKVFLEFTDSHFVSETYTYRSFDHCIDLAASLLVDCGVSAGDAVAGHTKTSPAGLILLFATSRIGAVFIPLNEQYLTEETAFVLGKSKTRFALIDHEFDAMYRELVGRENLLPLGYRDIAAFMDEARVNNRPLASDVRPDLDELSAAQIMFTSGTTSFPKGVVITHANMVFSGAYGAWQTQLSSDDRLFTTMPACHSNFQLAALMPVLYVGATLVVYQKYSASRFINQVRQARATIVQLVSTIVRTLLLQKPTSHDDDHKIRLGLYFLEIPTKEKEEFEHRFGIPLMNTYGSTETIGWVLTDPPTGERRWPAVGRAGLGYEVAIRDEHGVDLPAGELGDIWVKGVPGKTIMVGYFEDEAATAQCMTADGWFMTGDKGWQDTDGWFYFVDRKSNMIKRSGENISASEVETVLMCHPFVREAAVIGVPDPIKDQAVKAFIILDPNAACSYAACSLDATQDRLRDFCAQHLASYKVPSFFEFVDELPRTVSMKVSKRALREEASAGK